MKRKYTDYIIEEINKKNISQEEKEEEIGQFLEKEKMKEKQSRKNSIKRTIFLIIFVFCSIIIHLPFLFVENLYSVFPYYYLVLVTIIFVLLIYCLFNKENRKIRKWKNVIEGENINSLSEYMSNNVIEKLKKQKRNILYRIIFSVVVMITALIVILGLEKESENINTIIGMAYAVLFIILLFFCFNSVTKYKTIYKNEVIKDFVKNADNNLCYEQYSLKTLKMVDAYKYVNLDKCFSGSSWRVTLEDYIHRKYKRKCKYTNGRYKIVY